LYSHDFFSKCFPGHMWHVKCYTREALKNHFRYCHTFTSMYVLLLFQRIHAYCIIQNRSFNIN
jgi:hypothetical protein